LLLIVFTNVRLRGINSVVALLVIAFIAVLLAWFGWWDDIARLIPYLSVHMNTGHRDPAALGRKLSGIAARWYQSSPHHRRAPHWRSSALAVCANGQSVKDKEHHQPNDQQPPSKTRDRSAGDLKATAAGEHGATIEMPNVIFVDRKVLA
jgi:hypothetical protein